MDPSATVTVLAHAGHWAMSLIYVAPVLAVLGFIVRQNSQDRKNGGGKVAGAGASPTSDGHAPPAAASSAGPTPQGD